MQVTTTQGTTIPTSMAATPTDPGTATPRRALVRPSPSASRLNVGFVLIEAVYGLLGELGGASGRRGHNLSDVLGLVVAWVATILAKRAPTARYTYGMQGSSILAALFNAVFLWWPWRHRLGGYSALWRPAPVAGNTVMVVAAIGILVNGITAWLFASGRKGDINIRGAFLHMAADAAVSAGVVLPASSFSDRLDLARSGRKPRHRRRHRVEHLGPAARQRPMSLAAVPPGIDAGAVRRLPRRAAGRHARARPPYLADEHHRDRLTAHLVMPAAIRATRS